MTQFSERETNSQRETGSMQVMRTILEAILDIDILIPPKEYLARILRVLCDHLGCISGVAYELTDDGQSLLYARHDSTVDICDFGLLDDAHSLPGLDDAGAPVTQVTLITDPTNHPRLSPLHAFCRERRVAMIVVAPLRYKEQLLGSYHLYLPWARTMTAEEIQVFDQVGEMASVAIASNRYLEHLSQRTRELQYEVIQRKRMETVLRDALRSRRELEEIVSRSPIVAMLWRATTHCPLEFISASIEQFGYLPEQFYQHDLDYFDCVHPTDRKRVRRELARFLRDNCQEMTLEYRMLTSDGETRWVENRLWARRDTDGLDLLYVVTPPHGTITHIQGILEDITARKQAEETIRHQAFHDALTDLPNRVLFQDRLSHALAHARRYRTMLAVMFLDLDHFKTINDTLGHPVGDKLIGAVAQRLRELLREEDTVARMGGDEFTVLLPAIRNADDAAVVALKILSAFHAPFQLDQHELRVTTTVGISLFPQDGCDAQLLLQNADTALYHAKERGRNGFEFYSPAMYEETLTRMRMENALRAALERGEFVLHYQPLTALDDGRLLGCEALLRWQHPDDGLLLPASFLALAEESGLLEPIGRWVVGETCRRVRAWQQAGQPDLRACVNLSAREFYSDTLPEVIATALAESGLAPQHLVLEISEQVVMRDVEHSAAVMARLRDLGVAVALDDFGIGYSSLIHLKNLPISILKIDHALVHGLSGEGVDDAIVSAILTLARQLHLTVIAEGVETEPQRAILRAGHCDGMQGTLVCAPLPAATFAQLVIDDGFAQAGA